jgi:DNA-binding MarR family transcriptional regulator
VTDPFSDMATACYANRLRSAARAITRRYDAVLKPLDVRISQLSVLVAINLGDGALTIVDIANKLGMDRSTLSRNLDPLVRRGLVELGPEARHRARHATLTPDGRALLLAAHPLWLQAQAAIAGTVADLEPVLQRLDALTEHITNTP